MKAKISIAAGMLISLGLFWLALRNIDPAQTLALFRQAQLRWLAPLFVLIVTGLGLRGLRWKLLLDPARPVRLWDTFRLQAAGLALNNVLPLRLGEVFRGTAGAKLFDIPLATVFATIIVERALDVLVLFSMLLAAAAFGGTSSARFLNMSYLWPVAAGLAGGVAALVFADEISTHRFFAGFFDRFPRLKKLFAQLALGVRAFHSPFTGLLVFFTALAQWTLEALGFVLMARSFALEEIVTMAKGVVLIFTAALACSVPGMPGYFGNFEATIAEVLKTWGVPGETGLAMAAYGHIFGYLVVTTLGLIFAYQMGHSVGRIWAQFGGGKATDAR
jgi:glycosyltransferase 2 family protein